MIIVIVLPRTNLSPPDSQSWRGGRTEHRRRSPHGSQRRSGHGGHLEGQSCRSLWKYPTIPSPKPQAFFSTFFKWDGQSSSGSANTSSWQAWHNVLIWYSRLLISSRNSVAFLPQQTHWLPALASDTLRSKNLIPMSSMYLEFIYVVYK